MRPSRFHDQYVGTILLTTRPSSASCCERAKLYRRTSPRPSSDAKKPCRTQSRRRYRLPKRACEPDGRARRVRAAGAARCDSKEGCTRCAQYRIAFCLHFSLSRVEVSQSVEFFKARWRLCFYITLGGNLIDLCISFAYHQCDP